MNKASYAKREAVNLWSQMLSRAKAHDWSTFWDPDYEHPGRDAASTRLAFKKAGWSDDEINLIEKADEDRNNEAPTTSPGVAPFTEAAFHRLSQAIETAAAQLNIENREKVHFAVEPKAGPLLSKINVVMTDQSIVTMGSFFTGYCGLVSRAYVRTLLIVPTSPGNDFNEKFVRSELRKRPELLLYWWSLFASFALTGTHALVPFRPSTKEEVLLMEQVAFSMEIFGLAHEYAHHALNHGRQLATKEDAHREEFEADAFALHICETVEVDQRYSWIEGEKLQNPYLWTGAGGVLLLSSLEVFRKIKDRVFANKVYDTHPDFLDRSVKIKNKHFMQPQMLAASRDFCGAVENVLKCVMLELEPMMDQFIPHYIGDRMPDDWEVESFE